MEDIEQMLYKLFTEIAKEHHYENSTVQLKPISTGGANYTSVLYTATISSDDKEDLQLFAKVAGIGEEIRAMAPPGIFDPEYFVYNELAKKFKEIEDKHGVPEEDRFVFCKFYGFNPKVREETIVLENLAAKGFSLFDRMKTVDWPYASKAVESLAKFHALSMVYNEQYPEKCKELTDKFYHFQSCFDEIVSTAKKMVPMAVNATKAENKDRLAKFFENAKNCNFVNYTKPSRIAGLIHGDYRPSNIMHKENEDGSVELYPLDFQTIRQGCMVTDLFYFIFSSTDQKFRAQYYERLVELYYQQMCRSLRALHCDPEKVYSREDFETELKEALPHGLVVSVMILPIVTVKPEDAPDIHGSNIFESIVNTNVNTLYAERLNGVVDDYVRWGVI